MNHVQELVDRTDKDKYRFWAEKHGIVWFANPFCHRLFFVPKLFIMRCKKVGSHRIGSMNLTGKETVTRE
jgi:hypothetical protein